MTEYNYTVKIDEVFTHTLTITASNSDEASEKAYQMLRDGLTPEDEKACDYTLESDRFTGDYSVEVL